MAGNQPFQNELSDISQNLIRMNVAKILKKHNIQSQLSQDQKESLKNTVGRLQEAVNHFLDQQQTQQTETTDQADQNKNTPQSPIRDLLNRKRGNTPQ